MVPQSGGELRLVRIRLTGPRIVIGVFGPGYVVGFIDGPGDADADAGVSGPDIASNGVRLSDDPVVIRVVPEMPFPYRAGHDVEIIEIISVRRADRVVATGNHDNVTVFNCHRLIQ